MAIGNVAQEMQAQLEGAVSARPTRVIFKGVRALWHAFVGDSFDGFKARAFIACSAFGGLLLAAAAMQVGTALCGDAESAGSAKALYGWLQVVVTKSQCEKAYEGPLWLWISGLAAAPSILLTWYWRERRRRDERDHTLAAQKQAKEAQDFARDTALSERFAAAAALLASDNTMVRVNGLEQLRLIATQSRVHQVAVRRTLAAFVEFHTSHAATEEAPPHDKTQAANSADTHAAWALLSELDGVSGPNTN